MNYVASEYRIIRQGLKNFWSTLVGYHASVRHRSGRPGLREITRRGDRSDTTYNIILDPIEAWPRPPAARSVLRRAMKRGSKLAM